MNEYLSQPGTEWGDPNFTDIFPPHESDKYYRDSPLSPTGRSQAQNLAQSLLTASDDDDDVKTDLLKSIDLIVVSPLERTLQTAHIALPPHLLFLSPSTVPRVALPLAAERLYLVSDLGSHRCDLMERYPYIDFESEMAGKDVWWYTSDVPQEEWRPSGEGQVYACAGEPEVAFRTRMNRLCEWLEGRKELNIALVCHWGVVEWLTGEDFDNCQFKVVNFDDILQVVGDKALV
eukprot:CAMPEP_0172521400 /NCGR_PEP_ID=MMETSP1066-20121228/292561_1 /TAXON_ID=671091 /ORGANISM="Coscinodiscus wailesii, Strain CCMP2513" /LENGTH=232 /DNA_ID=CAMNT_0013304307 /DNA_START=101 /DNA_END=799 /DNA_ORIENTATION=+